MVDNALPPGDRGFPTDGTTLEGVLATHSDNQVERTKRLGENQHFPPLLFPRAEQGSQRHHLTRERHFPNRAGHIPFGNLSFGVPDEVRVTYDQSQLLQRAEAFCPAVHHVQNEG